IPIAIHVARNGLAVYRHPGGARSKATPIPGENRPCVGGRGVKNLIRRTRTIVNRLRPVGMRGGRLAGGVLGAKPAGGLSDAYAPEVGARVNQILAPVAVDVGNKGGATRRPRLAAALCRREARGTLLPSEGGGGETIAAGALSETCQPGTARAGGVGKV